MAQFEIKEGKGMIPAGTKEIPDHAFVNCWDLKSVYIPDSVTVIGNGAFKNCVNLTSLDIPESVSIIGESAFKGCKSLKSLIIPESVETVGDFAFGCEGLSSIEFLGEVKVISVRAFICGFKYFKTARIIVPPKTVDYYKFRLSNNLAPIIVAAGGDE